MWSALEWLCVIYVWIAVLASLPLLYWYSTRNHNYWRRRGVPGPPVTPVIGNFFSLTTPISRLYGQYIEQYGRIYGIFQGQTPALVVAEPVVIKRVLVQDFHLFRNRTPFGQEPRTEDHPNLVDARDEVWKRVRSIVTPLFTTAKLRRMESQMSECTDTFIASLDRFAANGAELVAHAETGKFTMDVIGRCAFATETNASEDNIFLRNARDILNFRIVPYLMTQVMPLWLYRFVRWTRIPPFNQSGAQFFIALAYHLILKRKSDKAKGVKPPQDLFQLMIDSQTESSVKNNVVEKEDLLEAHHGNQELEQEHSYFKEIIGTKYLSEPEIIAQSIVFFIAGYETTASTLAFCLFELATNPTIQERLYQEIEEAKAIDPELTHATLQGLPYLDAVLSETLRKYPPAVTVINRECSADRYSIPEANLTLVKGDLILFPVYSIHHCADFYPEPERFLPDRFLPSNRDKLVPYAYLPFGGGPRNCVGMRFALKEAKLGLARVVHRFRVLPTARTPKQLRLELCQPILKTEPIYLRVQTR